MSLSEEEHVTENMNADTSEGSTQLRISHYI